MSELSDVEITRRCAAAMGYKIIGNAKLRLTAEELDLVHVDLWGVGLPHVFDPLHDDKQAMGLVKKLNLGILEADSNGWWEVSRRTDCNSFGHKDLNRAICGYVANMEQAK